MTRFRICLVPKLRLGTRAFRSYVFWGISLVMITAAGAAEPVDISTDRQLFVDRLLIDRLTDARLVLHHPVRREVAIAAEHPWEKYGVSYMVTFRDGEKFRAWYRCDAAPFGKGRRHSMTAYAESTDGIHWEKPELGLIEFDGSKENNLVWAGPGANTAVFKDGNPDVPPEERYKAIVRDRGGIYGLVSSDGLQWHLLREEPLLTEGPFDSHNIAFWDPWQEQYVVYTRGVRREGELGAAMSRSFRDGVRSIRRATSKDFRNWTELQLIDLGDAPLEHLYTNACIPYRRARGLYLMFPSRYVDTRKPVPDWPHRGVNDIVLLSSRDGQRFKRTFWEAFVRPGLDPKNWTDRSLYMERGLLQTSPTEMSLYGMQNWRRESVHIRRFSLRTDGFASVHAGYSGGELVTRPVVLSGDELEINYSISAAGSLRVELQTADGDPIEGFTLDDCPEIYGDEISRLVHWRDDADLAELASRPIRLRFMLRDADLYSFRFLQSDEQ